MKVAVVGSRSLHCHELEKYLPADTSVIITGGAVGIDSDAEKLADSKGIKKIVVYPDYELYGKTAPLVRDRILVDMADLVVAVWDGVSPGTRYTISYAKQMNVPVKLYLL